MTKPFKLTAPRVAEHDLQQQVVRVLRLALGADVFWSSIDHASAASVAVGALRKARGVKAGLPDMMLVFGGRFYGIELKAEKGRLSASQVETHLRIKHAGGDVVTCDSVASVLTALHEWKIPSIVRLVA